MKVYILEKSDNTKKKYCVVQLNPKTKKICFGAKNYSDFTINKDDKRKQNYLLRHKKNEDWENSETSGFWSRWLLWWKPTIDESIKAMEKQFNIKIVKAF